MIPRVQTIIAYATAEVTSDEGFRAVAYLDTADPPRWTWGYGDTAHGVGPGKRCTIEQAREWRDGYLAQLADDLAFHAPWWLSLDVPRAAAVLNMAYQLGLRGVMNFRRMMAALRDRHWDTAAAEALDSDWAKQTPERAHRIADVLRGGPLLSADAGHAPAAAPSGSGTTHV